MATKTKARKTSKKPTRTNPTLHGLLIARTFSGTVVRVLIFAILVLAVALVGVAAVDGYSTGTAFGSWAIIVVAYLLFDVLYVALARVRPLHPRLDRIVLPAVLVFALAAIYLPLIIVGDNDVNVMNLWISGAIGLVFILGVRLALTVASKR